MRRFIVASLALWLTMMCANAQVTFGAHVGVGQNKVTESDVLKNHGLSIDNMVGPTAGLIMRVPLLNMLDLQAEVNYSMRGYRHNISVFPSDKDEKCTVRSSYLEIPLIVKVYPLTTKLNIQAGPQVGFLLDRSASIEGAAVGQENNSMDYGLTFGIGYDARKWCIDFRYYLGMAKTYDKLDDYKNRGISLTVGYYFK